MFKLWHCRFGDSVRRGFVVFVGVAATVMLPGCVPDDKADDRISAPVAGERLHSVTVDHVKDGDSFVIKIKGKRQDVRLFGIDAPEKDQPYADESRNAALRLLKGKTLNLVIRDHDRYGRWVADAYEASSSLSINEQLVDSGAAWVYTRYSRSDALIGAQQRAQESRRGLWADREAVPVPPWEWRKRRNQ